ncbi:DNA primase [Streptomyces sp. SudanB182_2057]|uniref:DNA primase n=1 Tax=Streptomyces sp. SudanB182_2057 TaxID=3035281 RepID=UPI003F567605
MNRTALGLAVGAGYLLGRTKKLKAALAVGSLVAGKKLNLGPRALVEQVNRQLLANPQFKEIGDQLRGELRGVGKAATGAVVERQIGSLADRLARRTDQVRDQMAGGRSAGSREERDEPEEAEEEDGARPKGGSRGETRRKEAEKRPPERKAPAKGTAERGSAEKKAPERKASGGKAAGKPLSAAGKGVARKTGAAGKAAAKRTAGVGEAARGAVTRHSKGGDDR